MLQKKNTLPDKQRVFLFPSQCTHRLYGLVSGLNDANRHTGNAQSLAMCNNRINMCWGGDCGNADAHVEGAQHLGVRNLSYLPQNPKNSWNFIG